MIDNLRGRDKALEPFGWAGCRSEWVALVSLHGGVFTKAQRTDFLCCWSAIPLPEPSGSHSRRSAKSTSDAS